MIIIPMAGLSSRFFKAGFTVPKYMLLLGNETVFEWSVRSFEAYFQTDHFIFICFNHFNTYDFVQEKVQKMGIVSYEIIELNEHTLGQADTVYQGIRHIQDDQELFIFNIDSKLNAFEKLERLEQVDGYLEIFQGEGEHWSFVEADEQGWVIRTTEKNRISNLCSNGLYYFKSSNLFKKNVEQEIQQLAGQEIYIAPLYNRYIQAGKKIKYKEVQLSEIDFCGTPAEYEAQIKKLNMQGEQV